MAFNIGLNVVEVDGAGAPALVGAATSVGAFNIITARGVPNRPVRVNSFAKFVEQFGSYFTGGMGAYLVKGFFDNGGMTAYINRVVSDDANEGPAPSALTLKDAGAKNALTLKSGFRGQADPGAWGNTLFARINRLSSRLIETAPATIQSDTLAATVDMTGFPKLLLKVDGEATDTEIAFEAANFVDPKKATLEEIRNAINRRTNKLVASVSSDKRIVLTSTGQAARDQNKGTSLQISTAHAPLKFAVMADPVGATVAPIAPGSVRLANTDAFQVDDQAVLSDGTRTATVTIGKINALNGTVEFVNNIGNANAFDAADTILTRVDFDLSIAMGVGADENVVESWERLSMSPTSQNYAPGRLNDAIFGSRYVMVTDERTDRNVANTEPVALVYTKLVGGRDGVPTSNDFIGDPAKHTGFYAFDPYEVQIVCSERDDPAIVTAALGYCANRGDCMFVGAVPFGYTAAGQAGMYGRGFQGKKVYGALYAPWIQVFDPIGIGANPMKWVPPTGHVMGVYARVETTRGIWKAPAGDEANIVGALDVEYRLSDAEHTDLVKNGSVNGIRVVPRSGIVVDASRTLSTDTRWLYVNVRLLFNYVKSSLMGGLRWVRQEPNRDTLWNAVKFNSVTPFLLGLWRQGAFGTGTPEQVFTVICDASNNPPEEVDKGNFKLEVYFYPSKPAETIIIIVGQQQSGAQAAEA